MIMTSLQDKLPKDLDSMQIFKEKLDKLDDKQKDDMFAKISMLNLKSPKLVFWVGSFLFGNIGVGRFMIGDTLLGGIRLTLVALSIIFEIISDGTNPILHGLALWINLAVWIWWIVDLFIVGKKLRKQNLEKIMQIL